MTKRKPRLAEVRRLPTSQEVVDILEEALAQARTGHVLAVGVVLVQAGGAIDTRFSADHLHSLLAGLTYLQHDIIRGDK